MKFNKYLDYYFKRPVVWDLIISSLLTSVMFLVFYFNQIDIPSIQILNDLSKDISTIGFTSSGFVLTFLTIIITFRSNTKVSKIDVEKSDKIFELFFYSNLYFETVKHFKNCVKILLIISLLGFVIKLFDSLNISSILFLYTIFSLIIIVFSLWRCVLIIGKILALQKS